LRTGTLRTRPEDAGLEGVTGSVALAHHTFCVCLLAMDQLSVDDRRCRPAAQSR
jgi:hypothetical protein